MIELKNTIILLNLFCCSFTWCQKHDYYWINGRVPNNPQLKEGGNMLNFNFNPVQITGFKVPMGYVNCTMSDKNGQLAFYTSGCYIANRNHQPMLNGDKMNWLPNEDNYWWKDCLDSTFISYLTTTIALPGLRDGTYFLFNTMVNRQILSVKFVYHQIDMNLDLGNGMVIEKNKIILKDTFSQLQDPIITRHGNGRDWWLVMPKMTPDTNVWDNFYYVFLLDPSGIRLHHTQQIGEGWGSWHWNGQTTFSPDGSMFVRYNPWNGLQLFDFDRCSGYFSNPKKLFLPHSPSKTPWVEGIRDTGFVFGGASFSPNSKMLYVSTGPILYQFDISQDNINNTRTVIAAYDTIPIKTKMGDIIGFTDMVLAPNGQIFISTFSYGDNHFQIIEKPDEKGVNCLFKFNGIEFANNRTDLPHLPNYRLGALKGSPCDSLKTALNEIENINYELKCSPNPATDRLTIEVTLPQYEEKTELVLCDLIGKELLKTTLSDFAYIAYMDVGRLAAGMYVVQLQQKGRVMKTEKVVVCR